MGVRFLVTMVLATLIGWWGSWLCPDQALSSAPSVVQCETLLPADTSTPVPTGMPSQVAPEQAIVNVSLRQGDTVLVTPTSVPSHPTQGELFIRLGKAKGHRVQHMALVFKPGFQQWMWGLSQGRLEPVRRARKVYPMPAAAPKGPICWEDVAHALLHHGGEPVCYWENAGDTATSTDFGTAVPIHSSTVDWNSQTRSKKAAPKKAVKPAAEKAAPKKAAAKKAIFKKAAAKKQAQLISMQTGSLRNRVAEARAEGEVEAILAEEKAVSRSTAEKRAEARNERVQTRKAALVDRAKAKQAKAQNKAEGASAPEAEKAAKKVKVLSPLFAIDAEMGYQAPSGTRYGYSCKASNALARSKGMRTLASRMKNAERARMQPSAIHERLGLTNNQSPILDRRLAIASYLEMGLSSSLNWEEGLGNINPRLVACSLDGGMGLMEGV